MTNKATRDPTRVLERVKRSPVAREAGPKFVRDKKEQELLVKGPNGFQTANSTALKAEGRFSSWKTKMRRALPHEVLTEEEKIAGAENLQEKLLRRSLIGAEHEAALH